MKNIIINVALKLIASKKIVIKKIKLSIMILKLELSQPKTIHIAHMS